MLLDCCFETLSWERIQKRVKKGWVKGEKSVSKPLLFLLLGGSFNQVYNKLSFLGLNMSLASSNQCFWASSYHGKKVGWCITVLLHFLSSMSRKIMASWGIFHLFGSWGASIQTWDSWQKKPYSESCYDSFALRWYLVSSLWKWMENCREMTT